MNLNKQELNLHSNYIIIKYKTLSTKGTSHEKNEDSYIIIERDDFYIFCIADGVGSLYEPARASKLALQPFKEIKEIKLDISSVINEANRLLIEEGKKQDKIMASTIATAVIDRINGHIFIATVGDSRVYLINKKMWKSKDQTLVQELVDMNIIDNNQAFDHPMKQRLRFALGIDENIIINTYQTTINSTYLLICSDGLHDYVKDAEIQKILQSNDLENVCRILVKTACKNKSEDDITIILAKLERN